MTKEEFGSINWHRGNVVRLKNGKDYLVKGVKGHGRFLLLFSQEYNAMFTADYRIVLERISDYEEPLEVYLEMKRQKQAEAQARIEAERMVRLKEKAERIEKHLREQERIHQEAVAAKAARKLLAQQQKEASASKSKNPEPVVAPEPQKPEPAKTVAAVEQEVKAPRKRIRQRIKISTSVIHEKVELFNKK